MIELTEKTKMYIIKGNVTKTITLGDLRDWFIAEDIKGLLPERELSPQQRGAITRAENKKKAENESK